MKTDKRLYLVMTVAPSDAKRKFTKDKWTPCVLDSTNGVLYLAGTERINAPDIGTLFKTKSDADKAVMVTKKYIKKHKLWFWGGYKIIALKKL